MTTKQPSMICIMVLGLILMSDVSDAKCTCCKEINDYCCETKSGRTKDACCVSNGDIRNPEVHDWSMSQCPQSQGNSAYKCCGSYQLLGCVPDLATRIELHELFGLYKFSYDVVNGAPVYEHIRGNAFLYRCTEKTCSHVSWRVHYARPTAILPTGRISFNCGLDCPAACIPMRTNRWWNTKTEEWVFSNDAIFQLIPTCDVGRSINTTLTTRALRQTAALTTSDCQQLFKQNCCGHGCCECSECG